MLTLYNFSEYIIFKYKVLNTWDCKRIPKTLTGLIACKPCTQLMQHDGNYCFPKLPTYIYIWKSLAIQAILSTDKVFFTAKLEMCL